MSIINQGDIFYKRSQNFNREGINYARRDKKTDTQPEKNEEGIQMQLNMRHCPEAILKIYALSLIGNTVEID